MNKKLSAILVVILCMALTVAFGMTAAATEPDGSSSTETSVSSEQSTTSSSTETSSDTTTSDVSSDSASSSQEQNSSGEGTSSEGETSSEIGTSSDEETSSEGTTSSKPNKPITSGGNPDSSKFIDETGSQLASENQVSTDGEHDEDFISGEYEDGVDEEIDEEYEGENGGFVADDIYKIIWIPITVAVLCIVALVVVNVMFRKKYPKNKKGASHDKRSSSYEAPKRRGQK